jgi:oligopeptidase B
MKTSFVPFLVVLLAACTTPDSNVNLTTQADYPAPPSAEKKPQTFTEHGYQRVDEFFWLKDKTNPKVIEYLKAENAYADTVMAHTKALQETLFAEMKGRIKEDDQSVPQFSNGYFYYTREEKGKQYTIHCRKKTLDGAEEIILDENELAQGQPAFILGGLSVSPDNALLAYASNTTGSYMEFTLTVKDLRTGKLLPDRIAKMNDFVWANDNRTLFYTTVNAALRSDKVFRHTLGGTEKDPLILEEKDDLFGLGLGKSKTKQYLFIQSGSFTSSETRYLDANQPMGTFQLFLPRQKDVQYSVADHPEAFYLTYKDDSAKNRKVFALPKTGFANRSTWREVIAHDPKTKIEYIDVYQNFMTVMARTNGLLEIRVRDLKSGQTKAVNFPEPVYTVYGGTAPEFTATKIRYYYNSLNRPTTTYDYDVTTGQSEKLKEDEIPSGFDPEKYEVKRLFATAKDGTKVPMALVHKKGLELDGTNPTLLYGYGSYGISMDAGFNPNIFSLVDRGFVYAIGQIRGGADLGETWYEDGKLQKKMNTFTDFIACAEALIAEKYTNPKRLAIQGGSAGGLLVGAVTNLRPDLFQAVVAEVPFVDVVNTMLDPNLPLTTQEYEQWGNPNVKADYDYIRTYSPYDNLKKQAYPNILATGGLNDSQVGYHEPAKWVAKLRTVKTDPNLVLLKTNLDSGHGGATGRFDYLKEEAFVQAFLLDRMGMVE